MCGLDGFSRVNEQQIEHKTIKTWPRRVRNVCLGVILCTNIDDVPVSDSRRAYLRTWSRISCKTRARAVTALLPPSGMKWKGSESTMWILRFAASKCILRCINGYVSNIKADKPTGDVLVKFVEGIPNAGLCFLLIITIPFYGNPLEMRGIRREGTFPLRKRYNPQKKMYDIFKMFTIEVDTRLFYSHLNKRVFALA